MTIAGHHSMMGGWKALPYDSRVAWLKSDGTAYVQFPDLLEFTGQTLATMPDCAIKVCVEGMDQYASAASTVGAVCAWGNNTAKSNIAALVLSSSANWYSIRVSDATNVSKEGYAQSTDIQSLGFSCDRTRASPVEKYVNDTTVYSGAAPSGTSKLAPTRLFAQGGVDANGWAGVANVSSNVKVSGIEMNKGGVLVLKAYAVRVGSVGYMFDEVSGELFGNSATSGALIYGSDIQ